MILTSLVFHAAMSVLDGGAEYTGVQAIRQTRDERVKAPGVWMNAGSPPTRTRETIVLEGGGGALNDGEGANCEAGKGVDGREMVDLEMRGEVRSGSNSGQCERKKK